MNIHEAVSTIIGPKLAHAITNGQGIHWAVIAAMTEATTSPAHAEACTTIRTWNKEQKEHTGL